MLEVLETLEITEVSVLLECSTDGTYCEIAWVKIPAGSRADSAICVDTELQLVHISYRCHCKEKRPHVI